MGHDNCEDCRKLRKALMYLRYEHESLLRSTQGMRSAMAAFAYFPVPEHGRTNGIVKADLALEDTKGGADEQAEETRT